MNILAIDIGGTMIKYGLISSDGKILSTDKVKTEVKNLNQIYQYFKNNPYRDIDYTSGKVNEYEEFIEKNINITELEVALPREIYELTKELDLQ